jgi:hypothetical protein
MYVTDLLKSNVKGVEGSFLMKDGEVIECDLDEEKLYFLSKSILFLTGSFLESKKDLRKISIAAHEHCIIFFYDTYILGTVVSQDTNFPLVEMMSNKLLHTYEDQPEKQQEIVDEILQRIDSFMG